MVHRKMLLICVLSMFTASVAQASFIKLTEFYADPTVTFADGGYSATIAEDSSYDVVLLSNDPEFDDEEEVIFPGPYYLLFDYDFAEASTGDDEFGAFVLGSNGNSAGMAYEFFTKDSSSGTIMFDLSGLASEPFIGLQFQLSALPGDLDLRSTVTISNVHTEFIPEPGTIILTLSGLGGIATLGAAKLRKRKRQSSSLRP